MVQDSESRRNRENSKESAPISSSGAHVGWLFERRSKWKKRVRTHLIPLESRVSNSPLKIPHFKILNTNAKPVMCPSTRAAAPDARARQSSGKCIVSDALTA
ncbi:hypothetical protein K438DRAFT_1873397 [Mycena galopus ATCC 62051]|nr:hypothetical protein K438DRAFT_1873397 [Mycena galopus ATCC 62051]